MVWLWCVLGQYIINYLFSIIKRPNRNANWALTKGRTTGPRFLSRPTKEIKASRCIDSYHLVSMVVHVSTHFVDFFKYFLLIHIYTQIKFIGFFF